MPALNTFGAKNTKEAHDYCQMRINVIFPDRPLISQYIVQYHAM